MSTPEAPNPLVCLIFLWWMVTCAVWFCRNQIAGPWTPITRFPHVVAYDKLSEYQVIETHTSIGE